MATTQQQYVVSDIAERRYSYAGIATWDGTTINDSDLLDVYYNSTLLTLTTHYTVDTGTDEIVLEAGFTTVLNAIITIKRVTDIDTAYVDFTNNSTIEAADLDLAVGQNRYKLQELETDLTNTLNLDTVNDCWDAESKRICNVATGTASTDVVTLGQVQNLIAGVDTADIDNITRWEFTGDGTTTAFTLPTPPSGLNSGEQALVFVDGVIQRPTDNYSIATTTNTVCTFVTAPVLNARIQIITVEGIVASSLAPGYVDSDAIANDAVTTDKINVGLGADKRLLVFDINGDGTARVLTHADISDFDAGVQANRLDQMAAPTADVALGSQKITGLSAGAASTDAVNKGQLDTEVSTLNAAITAVNNKAFAGRTTIVNNGSVTVTTTTQPRYIRLYANYASGVATGSLDVMLAELPATLDASGGFSPGNLTVTNVGSGVTFTRAGAGVGNTVIDYMVVAD